MKKIIVLLLSVFLLTACSSAAVEEEVTLPEASTLRLTTTTSVNDSGLIEFLRPYLLAEENMSLEVVSVGSGAAIEAGMNGDADAILVHSPAAEETFVADGYGIARTSFMHNFFVIVGPADDPAGLASMSATNALAALDTQKTSKFVSRGDNSGTHSKEKAIWKLTGLSYDTVSVDTSYYVSAGAGMGDTLVMASELQAYTLTDLATFLSMKDDLDLEVIVDEGADLINVYSVIVVNPDKVDNTDVDTAKRFETWITSDSTLDLIAEYGIDTYGQALFFVGAE